jgi:hypothetical protein
MSGKINNEQRIGFAEAKADESIQLAQIAKSRSELALWIAAVALIVSLVAVFWH